MSDILSKITDSRGLLEKIASKIPGFGGYLEKETRRTADKMLRDTIVNRYGEQLRRIEALQTDLLSSGGLEHLDDMQTAATRLQTFVDQVRTAAYGYTGFFDAVKVDEDALAKLYAFDDALLENVNKVTAAVDNVATSIGGDGVKASIRNLIAVATECNTMFDRRKEVLLS
jgi:hypothetical protein